MKSEKRKSLRRFVSQQGFFSLLLLVIVTAILLFWSGVGQEIQQCAISVSEEKLLTGINYRTEGWATVLIRKAISAPESLVPYHTICCYENEKERVEYYWVPANHRYQTTASAHLSIDYEDKQWGLRNSFSATLEESVQNGKRTVRLTDSALTF